MESSHPTKLMDWLFEPFSEGEKAKVLHLGNPLSETVDTFTNYRCKIHVADAYSKLPFVLTNSNTQDLPSDFFREALEIPPAASFNLCLFWDFLNFLDENLINSFASFLKPYLDKNCRAHAFAVHNVKSMPSQHVYGLADLKTITSRPRQKYIDAPNPPTLKMIQETFHCFKFDRNIMLTDNRIEISMFKNNN